VSKGEPCRVSVPGFSKLRLSKLIRRDFTIFFALMICSVEAVEGDINKRPSFLRKLKTFRVFGKVEIADVV